jgi:hypothetical protein
MADDQKRSVLRPLSSENGTGARQTKKGAAVAGGSKFKQGGVKQSGQEPLNVQKMDANSNDRESLTRS